MSVMRILVTGTRHTTSGDNAIVYDALNRVTGGATGAIIVVHGACVYGGVDQAADTWARHHPGAISEPHPAERGGNGRILGPARNARMVALGAQLCLAFPKPDSRGTWDCIRKAADAGIPTYIYPLSSTRRTA